MCGPRTKDHDDNNQSVSQRGFPRHTGVVWETMLQLLEVNVNLTILCEGEVDKLQLVVDDGAIIAEYCCSWDSLTYVRHCIVAEQFFLLLSPYTAAALSWHFVTLQKYCGGCTSVPDKLQKNGWSSRIWSLSDGCRACPLNLIYAQNMLIYQSYPLFMRQPSCQHWQQ